MRTIQDHFKHDDKRALASIKLAMKAKEHRSKDRIKQIAKESESQKYQVVQGGNIQQSKKENKESRPDRFKQYADN